MLRTKNAILPSCDKQGILNFPTKTHLCKRSNLCLTSESQAQTNKRYLRSSAAARYGTRMCSHAIPVRGSASSTASENCEPSSSSKTVQTVFKHVQTEKKSYSCSVFVVWFHHPPRPITGPRAACGVHSHAKLEQHVFTRFGSLLLRKGTNSNREHVQRFHGQWRANTSNTSTAQFSCYVSWEFVWEMRVETQSLALASLQIWLHDRWLCSKIAAKDAAALGCGPNVAGVALKCGQQNLKLLQALRWTSHMTEPPNWDWCCRAHFKWPDVTDDWTATRASVQENEGNMMEPINLLGFPMVFPHYGRKNRPSLRQDCSPAAVQSSPLSQSSNLFSQC